MNRPAPTRCNNRPVTARAVPASEAGYVLLAAMFLLTLLVISLAIAAPVVVKSIQRDRDLETYHRGLQYRRAVQLYYRKFRAYPPNVDALVNTNSIRFLRKKYTDPITRQADWKPVMFGQNKVPIAMGFFGQALSGNASTVAGIGPSGGVGLPGITPMGGAPALGSNNSAFGSPSTGSNSVFSSSDNSNSSNGTSSSSGSTGSTDNSGGTSTAGSSTGSTSSTGGSSGTGTSTSSSSSSSGSPGQTFGGAGIIGFSPGSSRQSIFVYKKKNHYNEWEFTYDPISDTQQMTGGNTGAIGQPASSTTNPVGSNPLSNSNPGNSGSSTTTSSPGTNQPSSSPPGP